MKVSVFFGLLSFLGLSACGSDSESRGTSEFSMEQSPIEVIYSVQNIQIKAKGTLRGGSQFNFNHTIQDSTEVKTESVVRKPIAGGFQIEVNDQEAKLLFNLAGRIEDGGSERGGPRNCPYEVSFDPKGRADYDRFELSYELSGRIRGEDCPDMVYEDFDQRVNADLDRIPFDFLEKIRSSDLWQLSEAEEFRVSIRVSGEVF